MEVPIRLMSHGAVFRGAALAIAACAAITATAQSKSPPSWGPLGAQPSPVAQPSPGQSITGPAQQIGGSAQQHPAQSMNGQRQSAASVAMAPPQPRDCRKAVTQANPNYETHFLHAETNGYTSGPNVDLGYVLNTTRSVGNAVQGNLGDLQVRIEQLRCENENLAAKLDYIIRRLP